MASTDYKVCDIHGISSIDINELYFSGKDGTVFKEDTLIFPMKELYNQFNSGEVCGDTLTDISIGSSFHHGYAACNFFKEMNVLKSNETAIAEMNRSLEDGNVWKHAATMACELEGNRDQLQEKESRLKSFIKEILKCDFSQENITAPVVLPPADCVLCGAMLEAISKNEEEYMKNLEKMLKLLKPGCYLLLISVIGATYFTAGEKRFHFFTHDEAFVNKALSKLGLVVKHSALQKRCDNSNLTDYKGIMFTSALKAK